MKKSKRKHGFSLTELLAVIIVIGIVIVIAFPVINGVIGTVKNSFYTNQENSLLFSGRDYFTDSKGNLPRTIGEKAYVSLKTLIEEGYTKTILDADKNACDINESKVDVINLSKGKYSYTAKLVCNNYNTSEVYGDWSAWQTTVPTGNDIEIETQELYNYQSATTYYSDWSSWTDVALNNNTNNNIINIADTSIIGNETDTQTLYQYQDQQWKWYTGSTSTTSDYYLSAPAGFPNNTGTCTTWYKYYYTSEVGSNTWTYWHYVYTGWKWPDYYSSLIGYEAIESSSCCGSRNSDGVWINCSCSSSCKAVGTVVSQTCGSATQTNRTVASSEWTTIYRGRNVETSGCLASSPGGDYTQNNQCTWTSTQYNYYSNYTSSAPSGYPTADTNQSAQACKYYTNTTSYYSGGNGYSSTAPTDYPNKDTAQTQLSAWSSWSTTVPTSETYRTISSKQQRRTRDIIKSWSGNMLTNPVVKTELETTLGKTLTEIESDPLLRYTKTTMYRYRVKVK